MRVQTPWVEFLRLQKSHEGKEAARGRNAERSEADRLTPRKMSESYHEVVRNNKIESPGLILIDQS